MDSIKKLLKVGWKRAKKIHTLAAPIRIERARATAGSSQFFDDGLEFGSSAEHDTVMAYTGRSSSRESDDSNSGRSKLGSGSGSIDMTTSPESVAMASPLDGSSPQQQSQQHGPGFSTGLDALAALASAAPERERAHAGSAGAMKEEPPVDSAGSRKRSAAFLGEPPSPASQQPRAVSVDGSPRPAKHGRIAAAAAAAAAATLPTPAPPHFLDAFKFASAAHPAVR